MSTIHFMSRERFEVFQPLNPSAYISICTPGDRPARAPGGRMWVAGLVWFREDSSIPVPPQEVSLLVSFIDTWRDYAWVVHCDAGISRSAAVARYISALTDRPIEGLDCSGIHANAVIKAALMHHLWEKRFREPAMDKVLGKLPEYVSCIVCANKFKPQAFGHEVCWECMNPGSCNCGPAKKHTERHCAACLCPCGK